MPTKAQGRQGKKHEGQYSKQFDKTAINKKRRAVKRAKKAASPKTALRAADRAVKNVAKGIPRPSTVERERRANEAARRAREAAEAPALTDAQINEVEDKRIAAQDAVLQ